MSGYRTFLEIAGVHEEHDGCGVENRYDEAPRENAKNETTAFKEQEQEKH
jgi:hypothetical protein